MVLFQITTFYCQKIPIELQNGHLLTNLKVNHTIDAKVFIESGFPKLLIDKRFAEKYLKSNSSLKFSNEKSSVSTWGSTKRIQTDGIVQGMLTINGNETLVDGVIIDFSEDPSWKGLDMVFPIKDFNKPICINYPEQYLTFELPKSEELNKFYVLSVQYDENTKGLYANCSLTIRNGNQRKESINGNFLFDLGASNPVYLNRNQFQVEDFLTRTQDFILTDKNRIGTNQVHDLAVLLPEKLQLASLELTDDNLVAFRMSLAENNQKYLGMIGNHFLKHSIVIFDFENQKLYFKSINDALKIIE